MSKTIKRIIIGILFVGVVAGIGFYKYQTSRIYYNEGNVNGNTIGNLYGNGLFCQHGEKVYFANPMDQDSLYVMNPDESDVKKLADDRVYYLNADDHYLYYSRNDNQDHSQMAFLNVATNALCRLKQNGKDITILDDSVCDACALCGNTVYYLRYDEDFGTTLYTVGIDGEVRDQFMDSAVDPRCIYGDKLYYAGVVSDHNIRMLDLTNGSDSLIYPEGAWMPTIEGSYLYFMDLDNGERITRIPLGGGDKEVISSYGTSDYNIVGNAIYYQTIKAGTDGLYRIDLSSLNETMVMPGQFHSINCTSDYLYFRDFFSDTMYHMNLRTRKVEVFTPPIEVVEGRN
ncbi:MAG: DUF5050 domain-containing protein [Pseudobutyrivibrio sp.]|nr:DUF5050 domain-containing protein [Pseudobutyrivibrio sp.]